MRDRKIYISVGKSRKEKNWKNKEVTWQELVTRFSQTHRTAETYAVYMAAKKQRRDEIKDIGGFVGGYLQGGRRKSGSVLTRQLLTLDLDFAPANFWDDYFTMKYGNTAVLYSTHSHSSDNPRYRLIMPLNREVFVDEYQAVARKVAGNLGIEFFDPSTFQAERLMYWPSTSKDGDYVFESQDGEWLDPDKVLAEYTDWTDQSEWPVSERVGALVKRSMQKQGDPLEKTGVVGAFCRTYSITGAIEKFLSDVYEHYPYAYSNRYTYKNGSTVAGLVVYEDKWAYSHHGTDAISGKLCNAFDLVRIHKFGLMDEDVKEETPSNKLPSYIAMLEFASGDKEVRRQIGAEKIQEAMADFANTEEGKEMDIEWMAEMETDRRGNYVSSINNIYLVLKHSPDIKGRIVMDQFENRLIAIKDLPWRKVTPQTRDFTDDDIDCLAHYLEAIKVPFTQLPKALSMIKNEFKIHPIREYLNKLVWDNEERLDTLLIDYLGAEDSPYTRSVTRKTLIGAVTRIFEPGSKFDTVLTLVGKKGIYKSEIIKRLFGQWFSDTMGDIHDKSGMENLRGVWGMEIAELDAFKRADQDAIKRFITSREDMYRPAYGKQVVRFPRQCIFIATTNRYDFLVEADERRFLPVLCRVNEPTKDVWKELTPFEIDQIWAEAVEAYQASESVDLSKEIKELAEKIREKHSAIDDREGLIENYLETLLPENWDEMDIYQRREFLRGDDLQVIGTIKRTKVCAAEIWCEVFGGTQKDMSTNNTKFIHNYLNKSGRWVSTGSVRKFKLYGRQRAYILKPEIQKLSKQT